MPASEDRLLVAEARTGAERASNWLFGARTRGRKIERTDNHGSITPHVSAFDTGGAHLCGIFDGGKVTCTGNNARHQLGPAEVSGIYGFDGL